MIRRPHDPLIRDELAGLLRGITPDDLPVLAARCRATAARDDVPLAQGELLGDLAVVFDAMARGIDPLRTLNFLADAGASSN